jgi:CubicO group peptidase (beta-lactamase class C family)
MDATLWRTRLQSPSLQYGRLHAHGIEATGTDGWGNPASPDPAGDRTQYALFSATKTATAIAVLQLMEAGRLQLDEPAADYLPQYAAILQGVSVRHLLSHQSGLNNPLPLSWIHLAEQEAGFDYAGFARRILQAKARQKQSPGRRMAYSNLNYLLLGELIAKVSGKPYRQYVREQLLNRLDAGGEIGFRWAGDRAAVGCHSRNAFSAMLLRFLLDGKTYFYRLDKRWLGFRPNYLNGPAYGGLIATARGLRAYLQALLQRPSPLLSEPGLQLLLAEQKRADGRPAGMTPGWFAGSVHGHPYRCHAGGGGGFYSEIRLYPTLDRASYLLLNRSGFSDRRLLDRLDGPWLARVNG